MTGVQTCALPISAVVPCRPPVRAGDRPHRRAVLPGLAAARLARFGTRAACPTGASARITPRWTSIPRWRWPPPKRRRSRWGWACRAPCWTRGRVAESKTLPAINGARNPLASYTPPMPPADGCKGIFLCAKTTSIPPLLKGRGPGSPVTTRVRRSWSSPLLSPYGRRRVSRAAVRAAVVRPHCRTMRGRLTVRRRECIICVGGRHDANGSPVPHER